MKRITDWLYGYCRLTITGASPSWCLNRLNQEKIPFWGILQEDEFGVTISVWRRDLEAVKLAAAGAMCQTENIQERGLAVFLRSMRRRWCLLLLLFFTVLSAVIVPRFVWFYEVEGNTLVPAERIIRTAQECGVRVGTYGKSIKPLLVKDMVLSKIPELAWLTVTQSGGKAKIVVREKTLPEPVPDRRVPRNVVASRAGMITDISVLEGSAAVKKGDLVTEGQLLISGYMDLEYKYRVCGAMGEVYARTWREVDGITPEKSMEKEYFGKEKTVTYLCLGRKRIKISPSSGIFPTGCDKMSQKHVLTLPGGLQLPISIEKETFTFYNAQEAAVPEANAKQILQQASENSAKQNMVAGTVKKTVSDFRRENGNYTMHTTLECEEMIARTTEAEIFKGEMQHDGTSD